MNHLYQGKRGFYSTAISQLILIFCVAGQGITPEATTYTDRSELSWFSGKYTYNDAIQLCKEMNSSLVKVDSSEIAKQIRSMAPVYRDGVLWEAWIGASKHGVESTWKWTDDTEVDGYTNWNDSSATTIETDRKCATIKKDSKWYARRCSWRFHFICQKDRPVEFRHKRHIFTFHRVTIEKVDYWTAIRKCQNTDSRLLEIHSEEINTFVRNNIKRSGISYWTGGNDILKEGEWKWSNATSIQPFGWVESEPNGGTSENCLAILKNGWQDWGCNTQHQFICEKAGIYNITISKFVAETGDDVEPIQCSAYGYPAPEFSWKFGKKIVSRNTSERVYEARNGTGAWLNIAKANLLDEGNYTCSASNNVGETVNTLESVFMLKVPSFPRNLTIKTIPCNTTLHISWMPNNRAAKVLHRVVVSTMERPVWNASKTATTSPFLSQVLTPGLKSATQYKIEVFPCPETFGCKPEYNVSRTVITSGPPAKVGNINATTKNVNYCEAIWTAPSYVPIGENISYEVHVAEALQDVPKGYSKIISNKTEIIEETTYKLERKPNRGYSFKVRAKTCSGLGAFTWLNETCITSKQAPRLVPKPSIAHSITSAGEARLSVAIPDQQNGPISCMFVIVNPHPPGDGDKISTFTRTDLIETNQSVLANRTSKKFIAVALEISRLTLSSYEVTVGNGSITECDVNSTHSRTNISSNDKNLFIGRNVKLNPARNYSIFLVTTTPSGGSILLKRSEAAILLDSKTDGGNAALAPNVVPKPSVLNAINNDGEVKLTVKTPDQQNGSISCIFVIVNPEPEGNVEKTSAYTLYHLKQANQSILSNENSEFIAIALKVPRLGSSTIVTLGNRSITDCNIESSSYIEKRSIQDDMIFVGRNVKLSPAKTYSILVVSTTPSDEEIFLKASSAVKLMAGGNGSDDETNKGNSVLLPVLGALAGVLLIALAAIALVISKRRSTSKKTTNTLNQIQVENSQVNEDPVVIYQNEAMLKDDESSTKILISDFEEYYNDMDHDDGRKFTAQFQELMTEAGFRKGPTNVGSKPEFKKMNRYKNILPFDTSRVIVTNSESGYINACFVDGYMKRMKFIAAQGPLPSTVVDFWLMIVEQNCAVIVMLAKCWEAGKKKCEKYWPDNQQSTEFGPVTVTNTEEMQFCGFIKRTLQVKAKLQGGEIEMTIHQYHFTTWPDHGFPQTTSQLLRMHKKAMQTHQTVSPDSPMLVHCSAGAGRTGTFIAYDNVLNESQTKQSTDVYNCILKMREQRVHLVQNCDQYILVHKLLLENVLFGNTDMSAEDSKDKLADIDYRLSVMTPQFSNLSRVAPMKLSFKGRDTKVSPYDRMKVVSASGGDECVIIDASYVESYDESRKMIAASGPTNENLEEFWRMIINNEVTVIVTLMSQEECECDWCPSNEETTLNFGDICVKLDNVESSGNIIKTTLTVEEFGKNISTAQIRYSNPLDFSLSDGRQIVAMVTEMQTILREAPFPIALIHCRDGFGKTGAFCAIVNVIERLNLENRIDVFRAVKDLRDCRIGMVDTLDRYILCHQAVLDYMGSFDVYSNFQ